jgi:DNA-binding beta-propeller fold protein YncE
METQPYQLVVIDDTTHALLLVDGQQGEIIAEMPYPSEYTPTELLLSPDQSKVYMPVIKNNGKGALFVGNLEQKSLYRLPVDLPPPTQFTLAPKGNCAYIADPNGRLYSLTIPTMSLTTWGNPAEAACVGLATDHTAIYSVWEHDNQGTLAVFNPEGQLVQEYPLPGIPTNVILHGDQHILVPFTSTAFTMEGVMIFTITKENDTAPASITSKACIYPQDANTRPAYPSHIAALPHEQIAYVVNEENASITVIDLSNASISRNIELGRSISCLHILPDNQLAIATSHIFADLSMIDLLKGRLLSVTETKRELLGYIAVLPSPTTTDNEKSHQAAEKDSA